MYQSTDYIHWLILPRPGLFDYNNKISFRKFIFLIPRWCSYLTIYDVFNGAECV